MAATRLRRTFHYPSESDDEDAVEEGMDERGTYKSSSQILHIFIISQGRPQYSTSVTQAFPVSTTTSLPPHRLLTFTTSSPPSPTYQLTFHPRPIRPHLHPLLTRHLLNPHIHPPPVRAPTRPRLIPHPTPRHPLDFPFHGPGDFEFPGKCVCAVFFAAAAC